MPTFHVPQIKLIFFSQVLILQLPSLDGSSEFVHDFFTSFQPTEHLSGLCLLCIYPARLVSHLLLCVFTSGHLKLSINSAGASSQSFEETRHKLECFGRVV